MEEEVEIVNSIYENCLEKWADNIYTVKIPESEVVFRMSFNGYPENLPNIYDSGKWETKFNELLRDVFIPGEQILFSFISEAKQVVEESLENSLQEVQSGLQAGLSSPQSGISNRHGLSNESQHINEWATSEEIKDRGSTFVARCIKVSSEREALALIDDLVQDKRLARATHNMSAWRIVDGDLITRNCDDDGETAAGSRMLHLLDITDSRNVVVVVSRWFGGTHLGPARFKHINACARDALVCGKFINN